METKFIIGIAIGVVILFILLLSFFKKKSDDSFKKIDEEVHRNIYTEGIDDYKEWDSPSERQSKASFTEEKFIPKETEFILNPPQKVYLYEALEKNPEKALIDEYNSIRKCATAIGLSRHKVKSLASSEDYFTPQNTNTIMFLTFNRK